MTKNGVAETGLVDVLPPDLRGSPLMRAVNTSMRALSAGLSEKEPIAFFCECEADGCFAICWMTRPELDARRADGWILSDGHRASEPWSDHSPVIQECPHQRHVPPAPLASAGSLRGAVTP